MICQDCIHNDICVMVPFDNKCGLYKSKAKFCELPCAIGDSVWTIRSFNGILHPQRGEVSEMFFRNDMSLMIVVKYIARGVWGETVFATEEETEKAIKAREARLSDFKTMYQR